MDNPKTPINKKLLVKSESPYSQYHLKRTLLVRLDTSLATKYLLQLAGTWGVPITENLSKKLEKPQTLQAADETSPKTQLVKILKDHLKSKGLSGLVFKSVFFVFNHTIFLLPATEPSLQEEKSIFSP